MYDAFILSILSAIGFTNSLSFCIFAEKFKLKKISVGFFAGSSYAFFFQRLSLQLTFVVLVMFYFKL